jgi:glycosyltransferase involved in cell wall biosynthesis
MGIKKTTNIAFLTDCFKDSTAGAEKQIIELAKRLDKSEYRLTLVSLDYCDPSVEPLIRSIGCDFDVLRVRRIYGLSGLLQGIRFFRFLKDKKIDIVQTYHFGSDIWGTVIARLAGIRNIISNRRDMGFWRGNHHVLAYQWINRWVKRIVVNAQSIKDLVLVSEGVPATHIEVIHNGVGLTPVQNAPSVSALKQSLGIAHDHLVLMHVANLKPVKGHVYLFDALQEILKKHPKVTLVLIGEDMLNGFLQNKTVELGIHKNVVFLGKRKDVSTLLTVADIGVLPSLSEGMSNAILEYMIAAKPAVVTNVGGNPELVEDGINGFLVEKESGPALAAALLKLIEDKDLRTTLGAKGRQKVVSDFTNEAMLRHYEHLYESLSTRKIKVMHFISSGGLFGAENVLLNIAQSFKNDHYSPIVTAILDERQPNLQVIERARELGLPVRVFRSQGRFDPKTIQQVKEFLLDHKIDILHTHNYKSDIIGALAARGTRTALISTAHGFTGMNSKVSGYERIDQWFLKKYFNKTVAVTDQMLTDFPPEKRRVIPNGIDFRKFAPSETVRRETRQKYNIGDDDILIGTVGRLSIEKDQALLIAALADTCRSNRQVKLMIVGDGPEGDTLRGLARASGLEECIIFTGLVSNPAPYYQAFDIFVLSSRTEGTPLTVLEAMASQVPVIATKVGGIPDIIDHDITGLLTDPGHALQLKDAIGTLMADTHKRQVLKDTAFRYARDNFSVERMKELYEDVYREILRS